MIDIHPYKEKISAICDSLSVKRLDMVGSAARDDFDPEKSDIDVLVEFEGQENLFFRYFELKKRLETLFNKKVDLIQEKAVKNPYIQRTIRRDRVAIHGS